MSKLDDIFASFWGIYTENNPHVAKIHNLLLKEGEVIENDHIALRTFNDSRVNIDRLARLFEAQGYKAAGEYHFKEKKLYAKHFEHEDASQPKVFISELLLEEFSEELQQVVKTSIDQIPQDILHSENLPFAQLVWGPIKHDVYQELLKESEYAAWVYAFGFQANHFTVNVNALKKYDTLEKLNEFLKSKKITLNASGGEIKGSKKVGLEQSSTMAGKIEVTFLDGIFKIPSCYYEFAQRYEVDGKLYTGFVASSADKIFESTNKNDAVA
ncbi:DUF1338 domain-containing protein [Piscirickettsia litoralis]|uniref:2-oxoadipate dioxygenase/decarboxylase n=1 Tax=Piscirickettsia litoralis TaxID=1891921 RepID=A0ABX3A4H8_9GAMM|nr:DUF1338 domain-containing protein [Piscirickettsia litoralis]ODN43766.1 succinyldiaminopimelate aminotransferase [Piscirickettsia litoralis]